MKKLLLAFAILGFVACGEGKKEEPTVDTPVVTEEVKIDTPAVTIDTNKVDTPAVKP